MDNDIEMWLEQHEHLFVHIATHLCGFAGLTWRNDADHLVSVVREAAWLMRRAGPLPERWEAHLHVRAARLVRAWAESGEVTGVGGLQQRKRRSRALATARHGYVAVFGAEPSDDELIDHHNLMAMSTRTDAERQGALASLDDLTMPTLIPTDPLDMMVSDDDSDDRSLARERAARGLARVQARLPRDDADRIGGLLAAMSDGADTVSEAAEMARIPRRSAVRTIARARAQEAS